MNSEKLKQIIVEQQSIRLPENWVKRTLAEQFKPFQENNQIIIIKGLRRCGKSTFMQHIRLQSQENSFFLNFDDDRLVKFTIEDFQALLEIFIELYGNQKTVYFDEIQNIHGWERFIRRLHDNGYKIYITGSNAHLFSREMGTHLTGRYIALEMFPYSFKEFLSEKAPNLLNRTIYSTEEIGCALNRFNQYSELGGIPDYVRFRQPEYLNDLYDSILYRDIVARHHINREKALKVLVHYLASHVGKEVSYNNLKNLLKLASANTVSDYCYYLTNSYLCFFINRYSPSLKAQSHYGKKVYFVDHGLAKKIGFRFSEDKGRLLENIVFIELKRRGFEIYYHREKKECDFIIKESQTITQAIQVCVHLDHPNTKQREIEGLREAMSCYQLDKGTILTERTQSTETFLENNQEKIIEIMPVWKWLLMRHRLIN